MHVVERIGLETHIHETGTQVPADDDIEMSVQTDGLRRMLYVNGKPVITLENVTYLADEGVHVGKRFTGAMVGIYALEGTAVFRKMAYKAQ